MTTLIKGSNYLFKMINEVIKSNGWIEERSDGLSEKTSLEVTCLRLSRSLSLLNSGYL